MTVECKIWQDLMYGWWRWSVCEVGAHNALSEIAAGEDELESQARQQVEDLLKRLRDPKSKTWRVDV